MKLTHKIIHEAASNYVGWNWVQLRILGIGYPPKKGWLSELIGSEVDERTWELFQKLKGVRIKKVRAEICAEYGVNVGRLAQTPMRGPLKLGGRAAHIIANHSADLQA